MAKRDLHHSAIVVGRKGVGKSTYLNKVACNYPATKKVLIIDVNGSPAYYQHTRIEPSQLKHVKQGIVKLLGTPSAETLHLIASYWRDGLIVFEDCTKYIEGNVHPVIKAFLVDHRMHQCDLIFTFHSIKRIPPFFWEMISYITIFKTAETFESSRNKNVIPNYEAILATFNRVNKNKDIRYNETVETLI